MNYPNSELACKENYLLRLRGNLHRKHAISQQDEAWNMKKFFGELLFISSDSGQKLNAFVSYCNYYVFII